MSSIKLPAPRIVTPAVTVSEVTIDRVVDLPGQRIVRAFIRELNQPLVLWQGDAYDAAGDWTQEQAEARVLELLSA